MKIRIPRDVRRVHELVVDLDIRTSDVPRGLPLDVEYRPTTVRVDVGLEGESYRLGIVKIHWPGVKLDATLAIKPSGKRRLHALIVHWTKPRPNPDAGSRLELDEKDLKHLPCW